MDTPISDSLLLLPQQGLQGSAEALQQQEQQHQHENTLDIVCAGAAQEDGVQLTSVVSVGMGGGGRPVPLKAPDCSRIFQASEESPCSILFSGPQLFNVAAEAE